MQDLEKPLPPLNKAEISLLAVQFKMWQSDKRRFEFNVIDRGIDPDDIVLEVFDWQGSNENTPPEDAEILWLTASQLTDRVVRQFQKLGITLFDHWLIEGAQ